MNSMSGQKLKGVPYTGTLPAVLTGTKAGYLHRYKVYGNLSQNGTPTPSDPIVPSECGERTANLFDYHREFDGQTTETTYFKYYLLQLKPNTSYSIYSNAPSTTNETSFIITADEDPFNTATGGIRENQAFTLMTKDSGLVKVGLRKARGTTSTIPLLTENDFATGTYWLNLVEGLTAPTSYIPYGYKLPLTSGSTSVDIYLGESQTKRRIKKLVLTGEETISGMADANNGAKAMSYTYSALGMTDIINNEKGMSAIPYPIYLSSHFKEKTSGYSSWFNINAGEIGANSVQSNTVNRYLVFGTSEQTQADFKAYLAAQYAAGTPVTIWYVLATEETSTLNEPLRKIGDYADTIDSTQTTAQIPTTANSTTISWGGEGLAPSEFDSVQEWVDIPTYKRVNGEWVADN